MSQKRNDPTLTRWVGTYRRCLSSQSFGPFVRGKDSASIVKIDEVVDSNVPCLRWSFGQSIENVRQGFCANLGDLTDSPWRRLTLSGSSSSDSFGSMKSDGSVISFHLQATSLVSVIYRIIDQDTIAVSITEIPERGIPSVQQGYMFRISSNS